MTSKKQHSAKVVEWRKSGLTFREIGRRLNVSNQRASQMYKNELQKEQNRKQLEQMIAQIKKQNGVNQQWPVTMFVETFDFPGTRGSLVRVLEKKFPNGVSFSMFLDAVLPDAETGDGRRRSAILLYASRGIGMKRYMAIVMKLNELDFGTAINREIHIRTRRIIELVNRGNWMSLYKDECDEILPGLKSKGGVLVIRSAQVLVSAIDFGSQNHALLDNIYKKRSSKISFNEFLDLIIPYEETFTEHISRSVPAVFFSGIGKQKYAKIVHRLLEVDFGKSLNRDIRKRVLNLKRQFPNSTFLEDIHVP